MATNVKALVERARGSAELAAVFTRLWDPKRDDYRRLFFAHKDLLFPHIEEGTFHTNLPLLYVGVGSDAGEQVLAAVSETREAQRDLVVRTADAAHGLWSDAKTIAALLAVRFVARNPALAQLVGAAEPSFPMVAKAIAGAPLEWKVFEELLALKGDGNEVGDDTLRARVKRHGASAMAFMAKGDFVKWMSAVDVGSMMLPAYGEFRKHLEKLLSARRLTSDAYVAVLQDLYVRRLVSNVCTAFWCALCQDDVACFTSQSRLGPNQLALPCPKCRHPMMCGTFYDPDATLRDACLAPDGMLGVAVGWLLEKHKVEYSAGEYSKDQELDFRFSLASRRILVESKMHKTHKDPETTMRHLHAAVGQAVRHAEQVRSAASLDEVWIVTNYDHAVIADELASVRGKHAAKMGELAISFVDAGQFAARIVASERT